MSRRVKLERSLATASAIALATIPFAALLGVNSPIDGQPIPAEALVRRRAIADTVMVSAGAVALVSAVGLLMLRQGRPR